MKTKTHEELDGICTDICEKICRWPHIIEDQEEMDDKCAACQTLIDLANFVEKLDAPCEIGDTAYWYEDKEGVGEYTVTGMAQKADGWYLIDEDNSPSKLGTQYAYLTRAEAEAAFAAQLAVNKTE